MVSHNGNSKRSAMWCCAPCSSPCGMAVSTSAQVVAFKCQPECVEGACTMVFYSELEQAGSKFTVVSHPVSVLGSCSALGWLQSWPCPCLLRASLWALSLSSFQLMFAFLQGIEKPPEIQERIDVGLLCRALDGQL